MTGQSHGLNDRHILSAGFRHKTRSQGMRAEDIESLAAIVKTMEQDEALGESLAHARSGSLDIVRKARAAGQALPGIEQKLRILGVAL
jgi:hypothetical protein